MSGRTLRTRTSHPQGFDIEAARKSYTPAAPTFGILDGRSWGLLFFRATLMQFAQMAVNLYFGKVVALELTITQPT